MGQYKRRVLYDVTGAVRACRWTELPDTEIEAKIKTALSSGNWPPSFNGHLAERKPLLSEPNLKARMLTHVQLQGKRRYLIQYSF